MADTNLVRTAREPTAKEVVAAALEQKRQEARERRAAFDAARRTGPATEDKVVVRISKFGDGLVSTGQHADGLGDLMHEAGDKLTVSRETAEALEAQGYAEIWDEPLSQADLDKAAMNKAIAAEAKREGEKQGKAARAAAAAEEGEGEA